MRWVYCVWLMGVGTLLGGESPQKTEKAEQINQQIEQLQDMKRGFEARALRHENMAEWLQFDDKAYLETRRHIQIAEENKQKAAAVQREIDRLQKEKQALTKKK